MLTIGNGLRYDHNEQFIVPPAPTISVPASVVPISSPAALRHRQRTRPSATSCYPNYSNPSLKPEKSRSYELGTQLAARPENRTTLDVAFCTGQWLTDAIASNPPTYLPFNVARQNLTGVEGRR